MGKSKKRQPKSRQRPVSTKGKKNRKSGPSGPAAGLEKRIAEAATWRLDLPVLAAVLDRYREGSSRSEPARRLLRTGFEHLVWRLARPHQHSLPDDHLIGPLFVALDELIGELHDNDIVAGEVEGYLTYYLYRAMPHDWRTRHILRWTLDDVPSNLVRVPSRTLRRWKKAGKELPKRVGSIDGHGQYTDSRTGTKHMRATMDPVIDIRLDVQAAVANSDDFVKKLLITVEGGGHWSQRRLVRETGQTRYKIGITLGEISDKLPGYEPENQRYGT